LAQCECVAKEKNQKNESTELGHLFHNKESVADFKVDRNSTQAEPEVRAGKNEQITSSSGSCKPFGFPCSSSFDCCGEYYCYSFPGGQSNCIF
jgi:hypothetical protein